SSVVFPQPVNLFIPSMRKFLPGYPASSSLLLPSSARDSSANSTPNEISCDSHDGIELEDARSSIRIFCALVEGVRRDHGYWASHSPDRLFDCSIEFTHVGGDRSPSASYPLQSLFCASQRRGKE